MTHLPPLGKTLGRIRAVLFDAAGTLFDPAPSFAGWAARVCRRRGLAVDENAVDEQLVLLGHLGRWPDETALADDRRERWTAFFADLLGRLELADGTGEVAAELARAILDPATYRPYDDVAPTLAALEAASVSAGVVTNFDPWLPELLAALGLDRFDCVVVSSHVGVAKPDARIFAHALATLDLHPHECVVVGDSTWTDIGGATAAGITAVLLDRAGRHADHAGLRIASLSELPALLRLPS
jgi:putative hydrolase of the HAD superfamily